MAERRPPCAPEYRAGWSARRLDSHRTGCGGAGSRARVLGGGRSAPGSCRPTATKAGAEDGLSPFGPLGTAGRPRSQERHALRVRRVRIRDREPVGMTLCTTGRPLPSSPRRGCRYSPRAMNRARQEAAGRVGDDAGPRPGAGDPPPFEVVNANGAAPVVFLCDHASNRVPRALDNLGLPPEELGRHIAWDIGAAALTRRLATRFDAPAVLAGCSRLVIDCNRRLDDGQSILAVSDDTAIPGNRDLTERDAAARALACFHPYHRACAGRARRGGGAGRGAAGGDDAQLHPGPGRDPPALARGRSLARGRPVGPPAPPRPPRPGRSPRRRQRALFRRIAPRLHDAGPRRPARTRERADRGSPGTSSRTRRASSAGPPSSPRRSPGSSPTPPSTNAADRQPGGRRIARPRIGAADGSARGAAPPPPRARQVRQARRIGHEGPRASGTLGRPPRPRGCRLQDGGHDARGCAHPDRVQPHPLAGIAPPLRPTSRTRG